jgi:hypothetical protein
MSESEQNVMRETYRSIVQYRNAVKEAWEHEARLVKEDHYSMLYPALRVLAV